MNEEYCSALHVIEIENQVQFSTSEIELTFVPQLNGN